MSNKITVKYRKSDDFKSSLINGAYGGISNAGYINVNFYFDSPFLPETEEVELDDSGKIIEQKVNKHEGYIDREILFCINMDLGTAKSVHEWIGRKISELEGISKK